MTEKINLDDLDEEYEDHESKNNFDDIPDDKYQVSINRVELTRSKEAGKRMFKWELMVVGGKHDGRLLWKYSMLEPGDSLGYFKRDLFTLGYEKPISTVPGNLAFFLDLIVEITKKTKKPRNTEDKPMASIHFNKLIGKAGSSQSSEVFDPTEDESAPF